MPAETVEWPPWKEFVLDKSVSEQYQKDNDYTTSKKAVIEEFGEDALRKSWLKTCAELEKVTEEIEAKGSKIMPEITLQEVLQNKVSDETKDEIKRVGCFIVRDVIPKQEADGLFRDLKQFMETNRSLVKGWPEATPSILRLYSTPTQNTARTPPNQLQLMRWINSLWHWTDPEVSADPLLYADAVRVRPGKSPFLGLGPHIDAGSLCRWGDKHYRRVYESIFSGNPEKHDCYDMDARKDADQMKFPGPGQSTVLRAFQGWTALTRTAPREGTIRLYPNVKWSIAYVLLRPFFKPPADESKIMDASAWTFDAEGPWFPGTDKQTSQYLSRPSHPHLRLEQCLLHVPTIEAGDTVWWHADVSVWSQMVY